ncbi:metalloregulator ArsR/SmtB family transcription factor [Parasphingorhabdus sp.]|uniref:ArsR/SmtB family transcription factor n=1 Tax=Parasphingorhabdus sp. TaxID=2709688 RepID=UPI003267DC2A
MSLIESQVFAALGDPTRLKIISRLSDGEARPIGKLTAMTAISRQGVTKHLKMLEHAGLVINHRVGRESRFSLNPDGFRHAQSYLQTIERQWDNALDRLRLHIEDG